MSTVAERWPDPFAGLPARALVTEVAPRDGLQSLDAFVPTDLKVELVNRLATLGLECVEATSFVSPSAVSQMRDAEEVMRRIDRGAGTRIMVLAPNADGVRRALESGPDVVNFVVSASDAHSLANARMSVLEAQAELVASLTMAREASVPVRLSVATAFGCPFEGAVDAGRVEQIARHGVEHGVAEVCLADTIGVANPRQVFRLCRSLLEAVGDVPLAAHLHNSRGSGAANLLAALQAGVERFDASVGGVGGCPFAPGASGNVCTEDMVGMLADMGIDTGVDLDGLIDTARFMGRELAIDLPGQMAQVGRR